MKKLNTKDYIEILKYYNISIPKSKATKTVGEKNKKNKSNKYTKEQRKEIKIIAEKLLADKLCKCIKTVDNYYKDNNNQRAIAICDKSVIKNKNLRSHKFTCKRERKLIADRKHGRALSKTVKNLKLHKKK